MITYLDDFVAHARLENGLNEKTIRAYVTDLRFFFSFIEPKGYEKIDDVKRADILDFLEHEQQEGHAGTTQARRLVSLSVYFRFLVAENHIRVDITEVIQRPRMAHHVPDYLTVKEVSTLLKAYEGDDTPLALRNHAILATLYASGLRASEIAQLRLDACHFTEGYLRVIGKRDKERLIPFSSEAECAIDAYVRQGRPELIKEGTAPVELFLSARGRPITRIEVFLIVKEAAARSGIQKNIYPHLLRHSFATHMIANGADLRVIQELLGHASIDTTQIYTHTEFSRIAEAHRKFHPRG